MYIFKTVTALQAHLNSIRNSGRKIGFVPTMGALHRGHLSLLKIAKERHHYSVVSIFVNPSQFGEAKDLDYYPRPIESDIFQLQQNQCDVLFWPDVTEVYPKDHKPCKIDLKNLHRNMEGTSRPGHFEGVVEVVKRLLDIVQADLLVMGQKDYQQHAIIQYMIATLGLTVRLVRGPIEREKDGLAMSSRNIRLSPEGRQKASLISTTLFQAKKEAQHLPLSQVKLTAVRTLEDAGITIDYFEIVDGNQLHRIDNFEDANLVTACTTVVIDGVRLLDNIILKENKVH
jgi:pantoate--beta-alanine ligase